MPEVSGRYQYAFDALGRLTAVEKDGDLQSSYEYDVYGNRVSETRNGETYQYAYNQANQLIRNEDSWVRRSICIIQTEAL